MYAVLISIHAPIRGRRSYHRQSLRFRNFNPRPHTGATALPGAGLPPMAFQSTPPYGGDGATSKALCGMLYFNPRPHTGATLVLLSVTALILSNFNPRPHTGATPPCRGQGCRRWHFNPRPHTGATQPPADLTVDGLISIHAPIRGRPSSSFSASS